MLDLTDAARAYLAAGGFELRSTELGFVEMERRNGSTHHERFLVWTQDWGGASSHSIDDPSKRDECERSLLTDITSRMASASEATGFFLVGRRAGLSQQFISDATAALGARGGIRTPIEFFDVAYKADNRDARAARSMLGDLLVGAQDMRRIAQPFFIRRSLNQDDRELVRGDLVEYLETAISDPNQGPKLRIIEGLAGSGKTVAFNALVNSVYSEFIEAKRGRHHGRRPIVFLPEHLRGSRIGFVDDVIQAVMETDVADAVQGEQFVWLLKNGYSIWMIDGLDEFYTGKNDFMTFLDEALSAPGSQAQFVICTRDSLLTSCDALRNFVERHLATGTSVEIFDLAPWNRQAWQEIAWLELEQGREGAKDSERVRNFVSALQSSEHLGELAQLPFYCSILLDRARQREELPSDEFDAIELLVNQMFDREQGKGIFCWQDCIDVDRLTNALEQEVSNRNDLQTPNIDVPEMVRELLNAEGREILLELIGSIAHKYCRDGRVSGAEKGLSAADVQELSGLVNVPFGLHDEVVRRLQIVMVQFAFFGPGRKAGTVDFAHQILSDYLAARYAVNLLKREAQNCPPPLANGVHDNNSATRFEAAMARAFGNNGATPSSLFFRYLAREIRRDSHLRSLISESSHNGTTAHALGLSNQLG